MSINPFGPLSAEEFSRAVDAPYGGAADILRKHDPMWGMHKPEGEKVKWKVILHQQVTMEAVAYVEAESQEEAELLAANISTDSLVFDQFVSADDGDIAMVIPA